MSRYNGRLLYEMAKKVEDKITVRAATQGVRGPETVVMDSMICEDCGCLVYAGFLDNHVEWHYDMQRAAERKAKAELVKMVEEMQDV